MYKDPRGLLRIVWLVTLTACAPEATPEPAEKSPRPPPASTVEPAAVEPEIESELPGGEISDDTSEPIPFTFETQRARPVGITLSDDTGRPVPARIVIREVIGEVTGPMLWTGSTDEAGEAVGVFTLRQEVREVELIVHAPGYRGACRTCEAHGPFAPSARMRVSADQLTQLDILMEETR